jgi:hypothetical protein
VMTMVIFFHTSVESCERWSWHMLQRQRDLAF